MTRIVTDTTCDLPPTMAQAHDITMVPINIHFGTETYKEGVDIDRDLFYRRIDELAILPATSQPSVGQFTETYRRLAKEEGTNTIISMHVTGKLSGTYQSAHLASQEVADEVTVHAYDSMAGSAALGFMCVEASQMARGGKSAQEILGRLDEIRARTNVFLVVQTLEYAHKSGRVSGLKAALASVLNIKPIIGLEDGLLDVRESVRSRRKSLNRLLDIVEERVDSTGPINLAVIHARALDVGQEMLSRAEERFNCQESFVQELCASLAVHFGPGTIGVCFYEI